MRKFVSIIVILIITLQKSFSYTPPEYKLKFGELPNMDTTKLHIEYKSLNYPTIYNYNYYNEILTPQKINKTCVPGRIPTFAFVATISAVGTYTLYGAGAGIVTCGLVYICTDGNRKHTRQAIWGCVAGMAVGGFVKWLSVR